MAPRLLQAVLFPQHLIGAAGRAAGCSFRDYLLARRTRLEALAGRKLQHGSKVKRSATCCCFVL